MNFSSHRLVITQHFRYAKTTYEKGYKVYKQWFFDREKRPEDVLAEVQSGSEAELDASESENEPESDLVQSEAANRNENQLESAERVDSSQQLQSGAAIDKNGHETFKRDQNGVKQGDATFTFSSSGRVGDVETYRYVDGLKQGKGIYK
jgi:hypothetical protein